MDRGARDLLTLAIGILCGGIISFLMQFFFPIIGLSPPVLLVLGSLLALTAVLLSTTDSD